MEIHQSIDMTLYASPAILIDGIIVPNRLPALPLYWQLSLEYQIEESSDK